MPSTLNRGNPTPVQATIVESDARTIVQAEVFEETYLDVDKLLHRKNTLEKLNKKLMEKLKRTEEAATNLQYIQKIYHLNISLTQKNKTLMTENKTLMTENKSLQRQIHELFQKEKLNEKYYHEKITEARNDNARNFIDMENEIDRLLKGLSRHPIG